MRTNKYVEDLKAKTAAELNEELVAAKKELFNLRFQNATNQLDNTSRIKEVRRNIARIQTVITEKSKMAECPCGRRFKPVRRLSPQNMRGKKKSWKEI